MALKFRTLRIQKVNRETKDTISIYFTKPPESEFNYLPGQYLTLRVEYLSKKYNRAYSLCTAPEIDELLGVSIKVSPGGLISNYLNENAKEGMEIEVLPPLGNFILKTEPSKKRHIFLIGAGSGITPLMSILKTVLIKEPNSKVTLFYGNKNEEAIIFRSELEDFKNSYTSRIKIIHSLSGPLGNLECVKGRLSEDTIIQNLNTRDKSLEEEYFICGPSGMMEMAANTLKKLNISEKSIHQEHFSAPLPSHDETESNGKEEISAKIPDPNDGKVVKRDITVIIDGSEHTFNVMPSQSILDAALDNDLDPPYACMIGSCCTCKAKLLRGKVIMDDREGLTDEEIRDGYILSCQSHPVSEGVKLSYDA